MQPPVSPPSPPSKKPLRILVTGGAGFVGSQLCERLLREGNDVICLDNLFTSDKSNIQPLFEKFPNSFEFIRHDVCQPITLEVDQIYNLACPASPPHYQYNPVHTWKTSVLGMLNMLELARYLNCPILQASTSECYGDAKEHPQKETYWGNVNCTGPRACYDEGKRAAETLCFDFHRQYGTKVRVVRIFNTYGPHMHPFDGRVVSNFIRQALQGEDITIYGTGDQTRSFQYVDDLLEGLIRMMNNTAEFVGPVNLGNPGEFTIKELAEKVLHLCGPDVRSKLVYKPKPVDDPTFRRPDITLAGERLGWGPVVDLDTGLQRTIAYFRTLDFGRFRHPTHMA